MANFVRRKNSNNLFAIFFASSCSCRQFSCLYDHYSVIFNLHITFKLMCHKTLMLLFFVRKLLFFVHFVVVAFNKLITNNFKYSCTPHR